MASLLLELAHDHLQKLLLLLLLLRLSLLRLRVLHLSLLRLSLLGLRLQNVGGVAALQHEQLNLLQLDQRCELE